jgi:pyrroloquinoline quinone (PQQ) biosynthesis protein C
MFHYVHNILIYNSQKLQRTQMSLNRRMDTENVVDLHNGVLFSYLKQWIYEILRQMDDLEDIILSEAT